MRKFSLGAIISALLSLVGCSPSAGPEVESDITTEPKGSDADDALAQFIPETPERPFHFAFSMMHQPDPVLKRRIVSIESVGTYIKLIETTVKQCVETLPEGEGRTCSIIFALKPNRQSRFWIEYHPEPLLQPVHRELLQKLEALEAPVVQEGPVSIAMFGLLWGGIGRKNHPHFSMIPKEWQEAGGGLIPDEPLTSVWPD